MASFSLAVRVVGERGLSLALVTVGDCGARRPLSPSLRFEATGDRGVTGVFGTEGDAGDWPCFAPDWRVGVRVSFCARLTRAVRLSRGAVAVFGDRGDCGSAALALVDAVPCNNLEPEAAGLLEEGAGAEGAEAVLPWPVVCGAVLNLCLGAVPAALPSERLWRFSAASRALARLDAVGLAGVPVT